MKRLTIIPIATLLMFLSYSPCFAQKHVTLQADEIDYNNLRIGTLVEVEYRTTQNKKSTAKGYIKVLEDHAFIIGRRLLKTKIEYRDITTLKMQVLDRSALPYGTQARITAPTVSRSLLSGSIVTVNTDTLMLKPNNQTAPIAIPLASMTRFETIQKKRNTLKGAGYGLLIGASLGALAGYAMGEDCPSSRNNRHHTGSNTEYVLFNNGIDICFSRSGMAVLGGIIVGSVGGVVGAITGASRKTDQWHDVRLDRLRLSFTPQHQGGFAMGMALNF